LKTRLRLSARSKTKDALLGKAKVFMEFLQRTPTRICAYFTYPAVRYANFVRGDSGFGSDSVMSMLEERGQAYLFKLWLSKNVKRHIERMFEHEGWSDAGQGWEGLEGQLKLMGWERERRVVLIRRALTGEVIFTQTDDRQQVLGFVEVDPRSNKNVRGYEYAVLVTNLKHEVFTLGQLYRDRVDAENTFDELKNQWGWGGFTTHDRRRTEHAGQTTITLTGMHSEFRKARELLLRVSRLLQTWAKDAAEQLDTKRVWILCCEHLKRSLAAVGPPRKPPVIPILSG
jgi:hypothetical protein